MKKVIFLDRDGTLIIEPAETQQVNSLQEMTFLPMVISALKQLYDAGYTLVIVSNQDNLGTPVNPQDMYDSINDKMLEVFRGEGIEFAEFFTCPHTSEQSCHCRKPKTGLVDAYFRTENIDVQNSYMIGDRTTDIDFAKALGITGILCGGEIRWDDIAKNILNRNRTAIITRKTHETDINITLDLDGTGQYSIDTGLKFFDHMLEQIAKHGGFDMSIKCDGDLQIDEHHTIEDTALALGEALKTALGDKRGIERYAWERILVMDEAKTELSLDLSGRDYCIINAEFNREYVGDFPTEMLTHFFKSLCSTAGLNLNIAIEGDNTHHKIESCFKAFARCLKQAVVRTGTQISSTKGVL